MADYATLAEVKAEINLVDAAGTHTATINRLITSASQSVDRFCNRPDGFIALALVEAAARYYTGAGRGYQFVDECIAITAVAVKDGATDTTYTAWSSPTTNMAGDGDWFAFSGDPERPNYNATPYRGIAVDPNGSYSLFTAGQYWGLAGFRPSRPGRSVPTVRVTARWGYAATVPPAIQTVTIMQVGRWYKKLASAMAKTVGRTRFGTMQYLSLIHI